MNRLLRWIISYLDLQSVARVEVTGTGWREPLAGAVNLFLKDSKRKSSLVPCLRGSVTFDPQHAPRKLKETWARALRFALIVEERESHPLLSAPLGRGAGAYHSLVIVPLAGGFAIAMQILRILKNGCMIDGERKRGSWRGQ